MSHLEKRRDRWYAVLTIPKDVRPRLGSKIRFVKSTETSDKKTAQARAFALVAEWKAQIARARGSVEEDTFLMRAMELRGQLEQLQREGDWDQYEALSSAVTDDAMKLDESGKHEDAQRLAKVALGEQTPIESYLEEWHQSQHLKQKTLEQMEKDARRMADYFEVVEAVTPEKVRAWARMLMAPKDKGGLEYSISSVKRMFSAARSVWRHLQEVNAAPVDSQPFKVPSFVQPTKHSSAAKKANSKGWQPFSPVDLVGLYDMVVNDGNDPLLADLIRLGMYTGARIEELCSLRVADATTSSFRIIDSKTGAGVREIPVHPEIEPTVRLLLSNSVDGYLLSGLTFNKYGDRSNAIGKRFGRLKKRLGFGNEYVFHSLRKTVVTMLEDAGVSENLTADIVGHEKPRITYGLYSGGHSLSKKMEALKLVHYPRHSGL